jgi:hypothetical protein
MRKFHGHDSHMHVDALVDVIKKLYQFYVLHLHLQGLGLGLD